MYPGDARSKWPAGLLTDPRVLHFWDEHRISGARYMAHLPALLERRAPETRQPSADVMWDAFYVYPSGDRWRDPVPMPVSWGYPIMVTHQELRSQIDALFVK
jgi:hypothetical protein